MPSSRLNIVQTVISANPTKSSPPGFGDQSNICAADRGGFVADDGFLRKCRCAQAHLIRSFRDYVEQHQAEITADTKAKVKAMVGQERTGAEIAKALGISLPSVQNIKKELGLVQKRKK